MSHMSESSERSIPVSVLVKWHDKQVADVAAQQDKLAEAERILGSDPSVVDRLRLEHAKGAAAGTLATLASFSSFAIIHTGGGDLAPRQFETEPEQ